MLSAPNFQFLEEIFTTGKNLRRCSFLSPPSSCHDATVERRYLERNSLPSLSTVGKTWFQTVLKLRDGEMLSFPTPPLVSMGKSVSPLLGDMEEKF